MFFWTQVVWYTHLFQNFPQFIVIHTVKGFGIVNKAEEDVFLDSLAFSMIHQMLAIWPLVLLPFLKPAWTSGSSWFTYCYTGTNNIKCIFNRWIKDTFFFSAFIFSVVLLLARTVCCRFGDSSFAKKEDFSGNSHSWLVFRGGSVFSPWIAMWIQAWCKTYNNSMLANTLIKMKTHRFYFWIADGILWD